MCPVRDRPLVQSFPRARPVARNHTEAVIGGVACFGTVLLRFEDQFLNFLVNALTGAFGVSIAGNGDITPEDIYEVLVGATADGTSISTLCKRGEDSYSGNDILYHLRTKFDLDIVSAVGNTLLQEYTLELLPEQVEVVVDFHLRPYYGDEEEPVCLYLFIRVTWI
jgi:hypothetical protein